MMAADGFGQVLRGEWTKFRTVRSTVWCVLATIVLTVLLSLLAVSASSTNANEGPRFVDQFHFVHQSLSGDGTVIAQVRSQENTGEWAKAGLMMKAGTAHGSPYAAILLTPEHGIRLEATYNTEVAGSTDRAPRWLKLTRSGTTITGFSSVDGNSWRQEGSVSVPTLPRITEAGLFVSSPARTEIIKSGSGTEARGIPTVGVATFDNVSVAPGSDSWRSDDIGPEPHPDVPRPPVSAGGFTQSGGTFTVRGSGDVSGYGIASYAVGGDDDIVRNTLSGVQLGLMAVIALGVLFATSEYKSGTIRVTLAASPRRGRVLAAKAVVLGSAVLVAGLIASFASFLITRPRLPGRGYAPPAYPYPSLADGQVLRAVVGTALFLALLAVFSLGIGAIRRRTVGAIIVVIGLIVIPQIVAPLLSINAMLWVNRLTPTAGLAIQQTRDRWDNALPPWAGLGVLCLYAAVALGYAIWQLRRRDA